jgi:Family of unknown function (DUF6055)
LNQDTARHSANWVDRPDIPLDAEDMKYASAMFLGYLARRFGAEIVSKIWLDAQPDEKPLTVVNRLVSNEVPDLRPKADVEVPIYVDYALASYFIWDHNSCSFAPDVFARYRHRALCAHVRLSPESPHSQALKLNRLACFYFRFDLADSIRTVTVEINGKDRPLSIVLAVVQPDMSQGKKIQFASDVAGELSSGTLAVSPSELDHLVLVVSHYCTSPSEIGFDLLVSAR